MGSAVYKCWWVFWRVYIRKCPLFIYTPLYIYTPLFWRVFFAPLEYKHKHPSKLPITWVLGHFLLFLHPCGAWDLGHLSFFNFFMSMLHIKQVWKSLGCGGLPHGFSRHMFFLLWDLIMRHEWSLIAVTVESLYVLEHLQRVGLLFLLFFVSLIYFHCASSLFFHLLFLFWCASFLITTFL